MYEVDMHKYCTSTLFSLAGVVCQVPLKKGVLSQAKQIIVQIFALEWWPKYFEDIISECLSEVSGLCHFLFSKAYTHHLS